MPQAAFPCIRIRHLCVHLHIRIFYTSIDLLCVNRQLCLSRTLVLSGSVLRFSCTLSVKFDVLQFLGSIKELIDEVD